MVLGPELSVLEWVADHRVEVLPDFAHTFFNRPETRNPLVQARKLLGRWRGTRRFARVLARLDPAMLLNHNLVAAEDLRRLAPRPERVRAFEVIDLTPLERARERTLPGAGPRTVFYCGRATREKGVPDLIEACGHLAREGLDLRLVVCGSGDADAAAALAARTGLGDRLDWRGSCARGEVEHLLDTATVAAVPSWSS